MQIVEDWEQFDALQREVLRYLIESIHQSLVDAHVPPETVPDLLAEIMFTVCTTVDGSSVMRRGDRRILPFLTFENPPREKLISSGNGSWMHELVHEAVEKHLMAKR